MSLSSFQAIFQQVVGWIQGKYKKMEGNNWEICIFLKPISTSINLAKWHYKNWPFVLPYSLLKWPQFYSDPPSSRVGRICQLRTVMKGGSL